MFAQIQDTSILEVFSEPDHIELQNYLCIIEIGNTHDTIIVDSNLLFLYSLKGNQHKEVNMKIEWEDRVLIPFPLSDSA